jgi:hypothetical protein
VSEKRICNCISDLLSITYLNNRFFRGNNIVDYEIHRHIGITQKSAWFMLHRIRLALQNESWEKFSGPVEVDETYIGGKPKNMHSEQCFGRA